MNIFYYFIFGFPMYKLIYILFLRNYMFWISQIKLKNGLKCTMYYMHNIPIAFGKLFIFSTSDSTW